MNNTEFKNYSFEVKSIDTKKGEILIKHATWDLDRVNDEIEPTAFDEQYKNVNPKDVGFWFNHHSDQSIGETKKLFTDKEGAYTLAMFGKDALGQGVMEMAVNKALSGVSMGYVAERKEFVYKGSKRVRKLKKLYHGETSLLVSKEPANPLAGVVDIKSFLNERKELIQNIENFCRTSHKAPDSLIKQLELEVKEMKRELDEYTVDDFINECEALERKCEATRQDIEATQKRLFIVELQRLASKI